MAGQVALAPVTAGTDMVLDGSFAIANGATIGQGITITEALKVNKLGVYVKSSGTYRLAIYDAQGQLMTFSGFGNFALGRNTAIVSEKTLPAGKYTMLVQTSGAGTITSTNDVAAAVNSYALSGFNSFPSTVQAGPAVSAQRLALFVEDEPAF